MIPKAFGINSEAFDRAGSEKKSRVHVFWQRRINAADQTTPYWFPSKTESGAIREDRLVFPIPPGTRWTEVKAVQLPQAQPALADRAAKGNGKRVPGDQCGPLAPSPRPRAAVQFGPPPSTPSVVADEAKPAKPKRGPKPKVKADPKLIAAARELQDRYLEHVNAVSLLSQGKYDVSRALPDARPAAALLPAA